MPKKEAPLEFLTNFLPLGTHELVHSLLQTYRVHLTITRERKTLLGDYKHRAGQPHQISVNGNLNQYAFLLTLLHELAHLVTFEKYGHRIQAHGKEWKFVYGQLLQSFLQKELVPADLRAEIEQMQHNPAATSCAEDGLLRVLRRYDDPAKRTCFVEEVPVGYCFRIKDGRIFKRESLLRKRYKCKEVSTGNFYLFSPVHEVELVADADLA